MGEGSAKLLVMSKAGARMWRESPLWWLRAGTLVLIAVLGGAAVVAYQEEKGEHTELVVLAFVAYAIGFQYITRSFPRYERGGRETGQAWLLGFLLGVSLLFDSALSVVSVALIPLTIEEGRRRWWLVGGMTAGLLVSGARMAGTLEQNWARLAASGVGDIAVTVGLGLLEIPAWQFFAYVAATLMVRFAEEKSRFARLHAELAGSQALLVDAGKLAERLRISRELHDAMGHHLSSLRLQLEVAEHLPDGELREQLRRTQFLAGLLLAEVRNAVSEWRVETSGALPEALRALCAGEIGVPVELDLDEKLPAISPNVTHALFRCTQEALTNGRKHGKAGRFLVRLKQGKAALHLDIEDNGQGSEGVQMGSGLQGIRARVEEIGGSALFQTAPGQGFLVRIQVPLGEGMA